ncbi:hypothetical protein [Haloprofundus salinisoli]|uniref:hypothetical protein n=1 Tax=Haloprofundus salinisoli TaxID=2876193 RepID=UPI001CCC605E|nr:hypothetical protein [Haloprofundus salinisoli]
MRSDTTDDREAFFEMAREFPARTAIFTFGLPVFALLQLINGVVHEGQLLYIVAFAGLAVAYSATLTRYHVATYRRRKLAWRWTR